MNYLNSNQLNAQFHIQCDDDYWLVGSSELKCTKDGKWNDEAPVCECKEHNSLTFVQSNI